MSTEDFDDTFDLELAQLDIPSPPKLSKLEQQQKLTSATQKSSGGYEVSNKTSTSTTTTSAAASSSTNSTASSASSTVPAVPIAKTAANPHSILVNPRQRGNPILKCIANVPLEFRDDIIPDFVVGRTNCILYLSLKYHNLNPDYICDRLKALGKHYELRVLLVQVDTPEPYNALKSLTRISLLADLTLMLAWNHEEAARIIETYKLFEKRPPDLIMERMESCPFQKLAVALTNIKPINKTDAVSLLQNFGNLENIVKASEDRLSQVVGLGPRKAKKLYKTLHEDFLCK